jgi:hypothetical protein
MEGKPGEAAATSSSTSSEAKGRSTPTAVEPPPSSSTAGTGTPFVQLQDAQSVDWLIEMCNRLSSGLIYAFIDLRNRAC